MDLCCESCGETTVSALFYRGPGQHRCAACGGWLRLAAGVRERRDSSDRRRLQVRRWPDWRSGSDRREAPPT